MKVYLRIFLISCYLLTQPCYAALDSDWDSRTFSFPNISKNISRAILDSRECTDKRLDYKIEFTIGKEITKKKGNNYQLVAKLKTKTLSDERYNYQYDYNEVSNIKLQSIKLNTTNNAEKINQYVESSSFLIKCNHNVSPVVIDVPIGYAIRYRIWSSPKELSQIKSSTMIKSSK